MRRIALLLVLLLLLPARGWAGDVMAVRMAAGVAQALAHPAVRPAAAPDECHEHHGGHHAEAAPEASAQPDACTTCQVCQACHAPVLTSALPGLLPAPPAVPPQTAEQQHTSAERTPGFKPPIS